MASAAGWLRTGSMNHIASSTKLTNAAKCGRAERGLRDSMGGALKGAIMDIRVLIIAGFFGCAYHPDDFKRPVETGPEVSTAAAAPEPPAAEPMPAATNAAPEPPPPVDPKPPPMSAAAKAMWASVAAMESQTAAMAAEVADVMNAMEKERTVSPEVLDAANTVLSSPVMDPETEAAAARVGKLLFVGEFGGPPPNFTGPGVDDQVSSVVWEIEPALRRS